MGSSSSGQPLGDSPLAALADEAAGGVLNVVNPCDMAYIEAVACMVEHKPVIQVSSDFKSLEGSIAHLVDRAQDGHLNLTYRPVISDGKCTQDQGSLPNCTGVFESFQKQLCDFFIYPLSVETLNDQEIELVLVAPGYEEYSHVIGTRVPPVGSGAKVTDILTSSLRNIDLDAFVYLIATTAAIVVLSHLICGLIRNTKTRRKTRRVFLFQVLRLLSGSPANYVPLTAGHRHLFTALSVAYFVIVTGYFKNMMHTVLVSYEKPYFIDTIDQLADSTLEPRFAVQDNLMDIFKLSSIPTYRQIWSRCPKEGCLSSDSMRIGYFVDAISSYKVATLFPFGHHLIVERLYCMVAADKGNDYYMSRMVFESGIKSVVYRKDISEDLRARLDNLYGIYALDGPGHFDRELARAVLPMPAIDKCLTNHPYEQHHDTESVLTLRSCKNLILLFAFLVTLAICEFCKKGYRNSNVGLLRRHKRKLLKWKPNPRWRHLSSSQ
ncbi:hypothetical protein HDE_13000 [Halotydeus destructor]|nr:hypothetical protein HDE_13000 [Halotydeus destructor]